MGGTRARGDAPSARLAAARAWEGLWAHAGKRGLWCWWRTPHDADAGSEHWGGVMKVALIVGMALQTRFATCRRGVMI